MRPLRSFTGTFRQRVGLESLTALLAWLYAEHKSEQECSYRFWLGFTGVTKRQARPGGPADLTSLVADTRKWPWRKFQEGLRLSLEAVLSTLDRPTYKSRRAQPRVLQTWSDPRGRPILTWRATLPPAAQYQAWGAFVLDELFTDLHGVSVAAIGRCQRCTHFFVRGRAGHGLYCSARCRYAASYTRTHPAVKQRPAATRRRAGMKAKL